MMKTPVYGNRQARCMSSKDESHLHCTQHHVCAGHQDRLRRPSQLGNNTMPCMSMGPLASAVDAADTSKHQRRAILREASRQSHGDVSSQQDTNGNRCSLCIKELARLTATMTSGHHLCCQANLVFYSYQTMGVTHLELLIRYLNASLKIGLLSRLLASATSTTEAPCTSL